MYNEVMMTASFKEFLELNAAWNCSSVTGLLLMDISRTILLKHLFTELKTESPSLNTTGLDKACNEQLFDARMAWFYLSN